MVRALLVAHVLQNARIDWQWYVLGRVYVLRSSGISQKSGALMVTYSQKKKCIYLVFYCFDNLSIAITLEPLIQFRWVFSTKCTSPNEDFNEIENWKCHMFNFWLIPLDHITYHYLYGFNHGPHRAVVDQKSYSNGFKYLHSKLCIPHHWGIALYSTSPPPGSCISERRFEHIPEIELALLTPCHPGQNCKSLE